MKSERCHRCSVEDICIGAYAGSAAFASVLGLEGDASKLTLFPLCKGCLSVAVERIRKVPNFSMLPRADGMPTVVDLDYICELLPHVSIYELEEKRRCLDIQPGVLYTQFGSRRRTDAGQTSTVSLRSLLAVFPLPISTTSEDDELDDWH
jgi:hypothetical protein